MTLKLKTNRNDKLVWWLLLLIPFGLSYIMMLIFTYCLNDESLKSDEELIIVFGIALGLGLLAILLYKFCDRRLHLFSKESIQVFEGKELLDCINVKDIVEIKYIKCNIEYLWKRISGDSMREGDACRMYVKMQQGNCYIIGSFSIMDAKKIKRMYGDLVRII